MLILFPTDHPCLSNRTIDSRLGTLSTAEVGIPTKAISAGSLECIGKVAMIFVQCANQVSVAGKEGGNI
jgi:hypothetical protein